MKRVWICDPKWLLFFCLALTATPKARAQVGAELSAEPAIVNLGSVGHGGVKRFSFRIHNRGSKPAVVREVTASCDCLKVRYPTGAIAPGGHRSGEVTLNLGRGFGDFRKYLEVHFDDSDGAPLKIPVTARFHPGLKIDKLSFEVEGAVDRPIPETTDDVIIRRIEGEPGPIEVQNLRCDTPHLKASHLVLDANRVRFRVEVLATHPRGRIQGYLKADVNGLPLWISIRGTVHEGIRVKPDYFNFSRIDAIETAMKVVELIPLGRPFSIRSIDVTPTPKSGSVTVNYIPQPDGSVHLIARPNKPDPSTQRLSGKVVVTTDHPACSRIDLNYFGFFPKRPGRHP